MQHELRNTFQIKVHGSSLGPKMTLKIKQITTRVTCYRIHVCPYANSFQAIPNACVSLIHRNLPLVAKAYIPIGPDINVQSCLSGTFSTWLGRESPSTPPAPWRTRDHPYRSQGSWQQDGLAGTVRWHPQVQSHTS